MNKQDAGRDGVQYELSGPDRLRLYYAPQTQAVIGQKQADGRMVAKVHAIGPPDNCMARIWVADYDLVGGERHENFEFGLDRECVPVLDRSGPWIRERRDLEELNVYLSLFGLKVIMNEEGRIEVEVVDPKEPQDYCDHEPDFYSIQVVDVEFMGGEGYVIDAELPCGICGTRKSIRFTIPEDQGEWEEDDGS